MFERFTGFFIDSIVFSEEMLGTTNICTGFNELTKRFESFNKYTTNVVKKIRQDFRDAPKKWPNRELDMHSNWREYFSHYFVYWFILFYRSINSSDHICVSGSSLRAGESFRNETEFKDRTLRGALTHDTDLRSFRISASGSISGSNADNANSTNNKAVAGVVDGNPVYTEAIGAVGGILPGNLFAFILFLHSESFF